MQKKKLDIGIRQANPPSSSGCIQVPEAISQDRIRLTERPSNKLAPHPHSALSLALSLSTNAPWSDILSVTSIFATFLPNTHALEPNNLSLVRNDPHARTSSPRGGAGA